MPANTRLLVSMVLFAVFAAPVWAAKKPKASPAPPPVAAPAAPERITTVEGITEYRLANGLRVLMFPDQTKQTITVNMTYLVGSRHENYGETGMAHLLEHMVFKGSPRHKDIPNELSSHGARPNGTTSWDRTNYFETFNATEENLRWALDLEADRMVNSFIAQKDLDSEMTVVRNEFEMGENQPVGVMFKRLLSVAYDWHNYANTPIGARSDIEGVPIENLQAFYRMYYQPDNAILLVAGKFEEEATLKLVNEYFGPIPRPTRVLPRMHTVEPTQDGERQVVLRRVGDVQWAAIAYHTGRPARRPGGNPDPQRSTRQYTRGPVAQGAGRAGQGGRGIPGQPAHLRSGHDGLRRAGARRPATRAGARAAHRHCREARGQGHHR
jgi:zinc protease